MNADLQHALRALTRAAGVVGAVASLPPRVGARVAWTSNGLIWTRIDEDEWQPAEPVLPTEQARAGGWTAPSAHVASGPFEILPAEHEHRWIHETRLGASEILERCALCPAVRHVPFPEGS